MIRCPSEKRLMAEFKLDSQAAKLIRKLAHSSDDPEALEDTINALCPATERYARSCYSSPYNSRMWRTTLVLHAIDKILGRIAAPNIPAEISPLPINP